MKECPICQRDDLDSIDDAIRSKGSRQTAMDWQLPFRQIQNHFGHMAKGSSLVETPVQVIPAVAKPLTPTQRKEKLFALLDDSIHRGNMEEIYLMFRILEKQKIVESDTAD